MEVSWDHNQKLIKHKAQYKKAYFLGAKNEQNGYKPMNNHALLSYVRACMTIGQVMIGVRATTRAWMEKNPNSNK